MNFTLIRVGIRNIKRYPWQTLFLIMGVALGVAVIVAIDIANQSAKRSFALSLQSVSGKATHKIVGGAWGIDEKIYTSLKTKMNLPKCAPVISAHVNVSEWDKRSMTILGIDIFAEIHFRDYAKPEQLSLADDAFLKFSQNSGSVIISQDLAKKYDATIGSQIHLEYQGIKILATIVALINPKDNFAQKAASGVIITDISSAQEMLGYNGRISHIDLLLDEDVEKKLTRISELLPSNIRIEETQKNNNKTQQIASAFQLNLTALSLLAILIGGFIIYDTVTFSVVRRRRILGILRSVGATRRDIFFMIMGETFVMALFGLVIGFFLGLFLGKVAVGMVTQTINDLYFTLTVTDFAVTSSTIIKSSLGVIVALIAALFPALEAAKIPPVSVLRRSNLETKITKQLPRFFAWGILLICIGLGILAIPSNSLILGFGGIFLVILGSVFWMPAVVYLSMKLLAHTTKNTSYTIVKMAPRNIQRTLSRTTVAVAALTIAISSLIAISIMIGSFRITFVNWIHSVLTADIFVAGENRGISRAEEFPQDIAQLVSRIDGVKRISTSRLTSAKSEDGNIIRVNAVTQNISNNNVFLWINRDSYQKWDQINYPGVVVSEPFAFRYNISSQTGQSISLYTDKGLTTFPVVGIYFDYASDRGRILMSDKVYRYYWKDDKITAIAIFLQKNSNQQEMVKKVQAALPSSSNLHVQRSSDLRRISLEIFDRTFAITFAMQILVGIVAFIGIISTLMALQLERKKEIGILRANGMTPRQLAKLVLCETGIMGAIAGIASIPLGFITALALIFIINMRSFGWTIGLFPDAKYFVQGLSIAIFASLLAGVYPAWKFAKTNIAEVLREE